MRIGKSLILASIGVLLAGGSASADSVGFGSLSATFDNVSPYSPVEISMDGGAIWTTEWAGRMDWTRTGGSFAGLGGANNSGFQFSSFCVELTQNVYFNRNENYTVVGVDQAPTPGGLGVGSGMGLDKAASLSELWGLFRNQVQDSATAAAFQVSIWEIVYDTDKSLSTGNFQVHQRSAGDTVPGIAQGWLNQLNGQHTMPTLYGMSSPTAQDQVFFTDLPVVRPNTAHPPIIPLPSAVSAGGLLLAGLIARRIRRR